MEINKEVLEKNVRDCAKLLYLDHLKIEISENIEKDRISEDYAMVQELPEEGYLIQFNVPLMEKMKIDQYQLRGLIIHELMHVAISEYNKFKEKKIPIVKGTEREIKLYSSDIFRRLNDTEEILVELSAMKYCHQGVGTEEGFIYGLPHMGRSKKDISGIESLKNDFKAFIEEINEDIREIEGL